MRPPGHVRVRITRYSSCHRMRTHARLMTVGVKRESIEDAPNRISMRSWLCSASVRNDHVAVGSCPFSCSAHLALKHSHVRP